MALDDRTPFDPTASPMTPADLEEAARRLRDQSRVPCIKPATMRQMVALLVYLGAFTVFAVYSLFCFWPRPTPSEHPVAGAPAVVAPAPASPPSLLRPCDARDVVPLLASVPSDSLRAQMIGICYLRTPMVIWKETQLVLLVLFAGAVGALLSTLRKSTLLFFRGDFCAEGLPGLYVWPVSGAIIGLVFYVFIRGGFFAGQAGVGDTSTYSFIATAMLAGMFTHEAIAKLKKVAEALLTRIDSKPAEPVTPATGSAGEGDEGERGVIPAAPTPTISPPDTVG